jgi:hypothetical membrane protein
MSRHLVSTPAATVAIGAALSSLGLLAALHALSPEFSPAWRMISEYGNGRYEWVLTLMFATWGLSMLALAFAIRDQVRGKLGRAGLVLLVLAGLATIGGGAFDINHEPGHSLAGFIGILGLPPAAILTSVALARTPGWSAARRTLLVAAHLTWISVVALALTFPVMMLSFLHVEGSLPAQAPQSLPIGVIALVGWANRLLMLTYCTWVIAVAMVRLRREDDGASGAHVMPES